jgi:hypothetical protein
MRAPTPARRPSSGARHARKQGLLFLKKKKQKDFYRLGRVRRRSMKDNGIKNARFCKEKCLLFLSTPPQFRCPSVNRRKDSCILRENSL